MNSAEAATQSMEPFHRDRLTLTMYGHLAAYGFFMYAFAPAQPLLRDEQGTSRTVAGLHGTFLALGAIIAGTLNTRIAHRFGAERSTWFGALIFSAGILEFVFFKRLPFTFTAALLCGTGGSIMVNNSTGVFHEHLPIKYADKALAEGNAAAALIGALGTTTAGLLAASRFGWRPGLLVAVIALLLLRLFVYRKPVTEHAPNPEGRAAGSLSRMFWIGWICIVTAVGIEVASTFWAAALVRTRTGASPGVSTLIVMVIALGMGLGRYLGSRGLQRASLDQLLIFVLVITAIGFFIFWFANSLVVSFVGLGILGLGVSMQYPLSMSRLIRLSGRRPNLAVGRASLAAGGAIGLAPLLLGFLGDHIGIQKAYLIIPAMVVTGLFAVWLSPTHAEAGE